MDEQGIPLQNTMIEFLGIEVVEAGPEKVVLKMPVGPRVHQPYGLLHGGASVALAESAASMGTVLNIDREKQQAVGLEINANHVRPVREGFVTAEATVLHRGRTSMVWDIKVRNPAGKLVSVSRCTVAIIPKRE